MVGGGGGGGELNFLDLLHMRNTHTNFQLPTSKTDLTYNHSQMGAILPPGTLPGSGGVELNFLDLLHMRDTHTNFQLPTSKTNLTYNCTEMGAILPPGALPGGGEDGGGKLNFLDLLHMRNTNTDFQLPTSKTVILLIIVVKWGQFYPLGPSP